MQDYEALRARVEETAKRMKEAQARRSQGNQSLVEILGALESKFAAQEEELNFYRDRVAPLEHANARLTELIGRLLEMVDNGFGDDSLEPMRRASAIAAAMLDGDMVPPAAGKAALDAPSRFEDVEADRLAADAATAEGDLETLPEFVRHAMVAQQSEAFENAVARDAAPEAAAGEDESAEIEAISDDIEIAEEPAEADAESEAEPEPEPEPEPESADADESVEALASELDRKSASGQPLEAGDIRALLDRVEALADEPFDDDDDIDIPPAHDEREERNASHARRRGGKTGTHG